jgi:hypothetical protein
VTPAKAWHVSSDRFSTGELRRLDIKQGDRTIARIHLRYDDGWTDERWEAVARLMAAAPELLEVLKLIAEDRCERLTSGSCWDQPEWTVNAPYLADRVCDTCIATRAIAKAEGE